MAQDPLVENQPLTDAASFPSEIVTDDGSLLAQMVANQAGVSDLTRPTFRIATVKTVADRDTTIVQLGSETMMLRRSDSLLIAVDTGDRVLCVLEPAFDNGQAGPQAARGYIIQVLQRAASAQPRTTLAPSSSELAIEADHIQIKASSKLKLAAPTLNLVADGLSLLTKSSLALIGKLFTQSFQSIRSVASLNETVADTVSVQAGTRVTKVKGADTEQMGTLVQTVEGVATKSADTQIIAATHDVRVDGERVSLG